jgi:hypothetical protein
MRCLMTKTLRFWIEADYQSRREEALSCPKAQSLSEILRRYEEAGDAMRYLNSRGRVAWKASPRMLARLADAEREVMNDWDDYS